MNAPFPPLFTILLVAGIFMLGTLPPLGLLLIVAAFMVARNYRHARSGMERAARAKVSQRQDREYILAAKSLSA